MLDIITVAFVLLLCFRGTKKGFIKTALGMVSVIACGFITVIAYNYISEFGIISTIEHELFSKLSPETAGVLKLSGIADYIVSGAVAVLLFIAARFVYGISAEILNFAVPKFLNSALGGALGLFQGISIVLFVLGIVYFISGSIPGALEHINSTTLVCELYYNNPVLTILGIKNI